MYEFTSERVMPYVYWLFHKTSGEYYIGARSANTKPSHLDLGTKYFTSSDDIDEIGFENFDWIIFAEFFDGLEAFKNEDDLIEKHLYDPLCLNVKSTRNWNTVGRNPYRNKSPEEMIEINERRRITILNKTDEEKDETKRRIAEARANKTDEEKAETYRIRKENWDKKTEDQILELGKKISDGLNSRSDEDKKLHSKRSAEAWTNKSEEEMITFSQLMSDVQAIRTPEEKAESARRTTETYENQTAEEKLIISNNLIASYAKRTLEQNIETNKLKSIAKKGVKHRIVECVYCGKKGGASSMSRYHFDKCKKKGLHKEKNTL